MKIKKKKNEELIIKREEWNKIRYQSQSAPIRKRYVENRVKNGLDY